MKNLTTLLLLFIGISASAQSWRTLPFDKTTHQDNYHDLYFHSETSGHLVGDNWSYLQTFDEGRTWSPKDISSLMDSIFKRVIFLNDSVGFLQGESWIYKTLDGGESWTRVHLGEYRNKIGIWEGQVFVYGDAGFGSLYFSRYYLDKDSFHTQHGAWPMYNLEKLVYIGDSTLIIAKDTGKIYRSTDLGKTFVLVANNLDLNENFNSRVGDIYFKNKDTGFISYDHWGLAHTIDGGVNWAIDSFYYNNSITRFEEWENKVYFSSGVANVLYSDRVHYFSGTNLKLDTVLSHQDFRNTNFQLMSTNGTNLYVGLFNNIYYKSLGSLNVRKINPYSLNTYPNPSSGKFTIELSFNDTKNLKIEVLNSLGQRISSDYTFTGSHLELKLNNSGIYFLQLYQKGDLIYSSKLIVE